MSGLGGFLIGGGSTFASMTVTAPTAVFFQNATTTTITGNFTFTGTSANVIYLGSSTSAATTVSVGAGSGTSSCAYCFIRGIAFAGAGVTFTGPNSVDLGL